MSIDPIQNGESGASVRAKLNTAIGEVNGLGTAAQADTGDFATAGRRDPSSSPNTLVPQYARGRIAPATAESRYPGRATDPVVQAALGRSPVRVISACARPSFVGSGPRLVSASARSLFAA